MTDEVLKNKLAAIEERAARLQQSWVEQSQQRIVQGGDPKAESRLEALIESLENSTQGAKLPADENSEGKLPERDRLRKTGELH
jgi:hypothetical protein